MKNGMLLFATLGIFLGCKTLDAQQSKIKLRFLDEYAFVANKKFKNTVIGGLSGIDYHNNLYYLVVDDPKTPRVYKADIKIENNKINTINFKDVILFDKKHPFFSKKHLDLESVVVLNNQLVITSEGKINRGKDPFIFQTNLEGEYKNSFELPKKFLAKSEQKPRNNGVFEGLGKSFKGEGIWSAIEYPLKEDGEMATYPDSNSPVRFTYFSAKTRAPVKEFAYKISPLPRPKKGKVNINGVTDILEYKENHFFVIERVYQNGYKNDGNIIRIFEAVINDTTTNTLTISSLKKSAYVPMKKRLLFDSNLVKEHLTNQRVDNIEGITLGPKLPNGNQSLILVSDDNFQLYGKQLNQFILLEIINEF